MGSNSSDESDEYTVGAQHKRRRTIMTRGSRRSSNNVAQDRPRLRDRRRTQCTAHITQRASTPELLEVLGSSQPPSDDDADDAYKGLSSGEESAMPPVSTPLISSRTRRAKERSRNRISVMSSRARANSISSGESNAEADSPPAAAIATPSERQTTARKRPAGRKTSPRTQDTTPPQYNLRRRSTNISYKQPELPQPPSSGYQRYMQMIRALEREATEFAAISELEDAISEETVREPAAAAAAAAENLAGADEPEMILPDNLAELGRERCRRAGVFNEAAFKARGKVPATSFSDVGGLDGFIGSLKEMVVLPLVYPQLQQQLGIRTPRGVLFHGPPGTGKTLLARALAQSCGRMGKGQPIAFFMRRGADCLSKYVGEGERLLRQLFEQARRFQPSIIFFDELDGLAPVRSARQDQVHASIVATLLALMDGVDDRGNVVVIGATNRPDAIDPALRRPGRFDREMRFTLPGPEARLRILRIHTRAWQQPLSADIEQEIVESTQGWGGADLGALCSEAALAAIRRCCPRLYDGGRMNAVTVTPADIRQALGTVAPAALRNGSALTAALPASLRPLLERHEERALRQLQQALGMSPQTPGTPQQAVYRPRVALYGICGMGVQTVGAAVAHRMDAWQVPVFVLSASAMLDDPSIPATALISRTLAEARRRQPSVVFIPMLTQLSDIIGSSATAFLAQSVQSLPMNDRVAVLVSAEAPVAAVANVPVDHSDGGMLSHAERIWRNAVPAFARSWFAGSPATRKVCVGFPTSSQRSAFFRPFLEQAASVASLQVSEPTMEEIPDTPEASGLLELADVDTAACSRDSGDATTDQRSLLRQVQRGLQPAIDVLLKNKLFRRFSNPPSPQRYPQYFDIISTPMFLSTVALKIRAGKYLDASEFLEDISLVASNARLFARSGASRRAGSDSDNSDGNGAVKDTVKYTDLLQSAAARLVERHLGSREQSDCNEDRLKDYSDKDQEWPQAHPITPSSIPSTPTEPPAPMQEVSITSRPTALKPTSSLIPQVVPSKPTRKPSLVDTQKHFASELLKVSCGFSIEALESLRVRLASQLSASNAAGSLVYVELRKSLYIWYEDASRDRQNDGCLDTLMFEA
ncbi:TAT-binding protein-like protein 7, AAA ATPase [Coemansia sp. RSA 1085]|nr:TAT-binding protein-like protein 7, AAA ATPase [Coemansia sp. RSA 1085]